MRTLSSIAIAVSLGAGPVLAAQAPLAPEMKEASEKAVVEVKEGWTNKLSIGLSASATTSRNVVGSLDGATLLIGFQGDGSAELRRGQYRWVNEGRYVFTVTRAPAIPLLLKTADTLSLKSTYLYAFESVPWLGPFARANLAVPIFPGDLAVVDEGILTRVDLEEAQPIEPLTRLRLTGALEPLLLREVIGMFAQPIDRPPRVKLGFQLGAGAEELIARDGLVLEDDQDTETLIELRRLENYLSIGAELTASASGAISESVLWSLDASLFQPVYNNADTDLGGIELLNIDASGKISIKLARWASLDLVASARRYPLILESWQLQSGAVLTATFNLL